MRAPHRSYFESLSTSGPALGDGFTLWADLPEADIPLSGGAFEDDSGVGRGGELAVGDVVEPEADAEGILDEPGGDAGDSLGYPEVGYKDSAGDF